MKRSVDSLEKVLSESEAPLSLQNLHNFIEFSAVSPDVSHYTDGGNEDALAQSLNQMVGFRRSFFIYDVQKQLLYSSAERGLGLKSTKNDQIIRYHGENSGFLLERRLVSKQTGKTIGYLQAFYDMSFYQNIRRNLFLSLVVLEVLALIIAQIIGYYMTSRFLKPVEKLHHAMQSVAKAPESEFSPIEIKTGDEIEELADVYNEMMQKTHSYLEHQKRFVSDVSHELRTPLAVLDGHINLLSRWGKDDPQILNESLEASREEIDRMKAMLEEMLALSRLENISLDLEKMNCDPIKVCQFVLKNFKLMHEDFEIKLENQLSGQIRAKIYENHYEQGLSILLDNAVKYSPDERKVVQITLSEDADFLITRVTDQGIGMSEEDMVHVFERFFRADKARNRKIDGTGLGLSIISSLIKNYHGEIEVKSELGKGSTFTLKIPKLI